MRSTSIAGSHDLLERTSQAFGRNIEVARHQPRHRRAPIAHFIVAKHAVDSELALLDGVVRTLSRGTSGAPASLRIG